MSAYDMILNKSTWSIIHKLFLKKISYKNEKEVILCFSPVMETSVYILKVPLSCTADVL